MGDKVTKLKLTNIDYARIRGKLFSFFSSKNGRPVDINDIDDYIQDVFVIVLTRVDLSKYKELDALSIGVAKNVQKRRAGHIALKRLHLSLHYTEDYEIMPNRDRDSLIVEEALSVPSFENKFILPDGRDKGREVAEAFYRRAYESLSKRNKEIVQLRYRERKKHAETARILGVSTPYVQKTFCKLKKRLTAALTSIREEVVYA